jgi:hypothetical protein
LSEIYDSERKATIQEAIKAPILIGNNQDTVDIRVVYFIKFFTWSAFLAVRAMGLDGSSKRVRR